MQHTVNIFDILFLAGRVIFGGYFVFNGLDHFMKLGMMAGYAKSKGVPAPSIAVPVTGLMILLGGLSIILGFHPTIGSILLAAFLIPTSFIMHGYWRVQEPQGKMAEMVNFTKNMALLGALLMFLAIPRPFVLSVMLW
ncbi:MAG: DoxX family protein [Ignavibacteriales bacterium CG07_land_8_20_14_0_80_59_12]|nr:MAG: DoxX family protein [Ignavibacteriales bacterium CG07_land_8_20_14_0_80_59_12]